MLKVALVVLAIVIILVLIVVAVGYALPVGHVASSQATLRQTPDAVFTTLSDVSHFPDWRSDVSGVEKRRHHVRCRGVGASATSAGPHRRCVAAVRR
jgi:hypothetical protein